MEIIKIKNAKLNVSISKAYDRYPVQLQLWKNDALIICADASQLRNDDCTFEMEVPAGEYRVVIVDSEGIFCDTIVKATL